jgi:hypothetical protein
MVAKKSHKKPVAKKAKTVHLDELAATAWEHYRGYLESCDNEDNQEGDTDELVEIMELLSPHVAKLSSGSGGGNNDKAVKIKTLNTKTALLPVLLSVVSYMLADFAIGLFLQPPPKNPDDGDTGDGAGDDDNAATIEQVQQHLENATSYFPLNAAAWSMGANFGRMTKRLASLQKIATWYELAAAQAVKVRAGALALLEDETVDDSVKEWIEMLLLNQVAGVELEDGSDGGGDEEEEDEEGQDDGVWSSSSVESTSRFMAAMLRSTTGDHDQALKHLQEFPLTDRLHPNVWLGKETPAKASNKKPATTSEGFQAPVSFQIPEGLLPTDVYERLCKVFAPGAAYWKESDYDTRGYYSYFMDRPPPGQAPTNLFEEVMVDHLMPLAAKQLDEETAASICGFEWWVHTRPIQANLGHNLHFDTDEALLSQEGKITHPLVSSVLYLTGGNQGGATIVLDQTPDSETNAEQCWRSVPTDNSFMVFPGNLLHGVLPCPGKSPTIAAPPAASEPVAVSDLWKDPASSSAAPVQHRLTLMVGFWTRRVPDKMKHQRLYGPCGPMPPCTDEHTWVQEISQGYGTKKGGNKSKSKKSNKAATAKKDVANDDALQVVPIPRVTPTWESFQSNASLEEQPLMIPRAIDHRFFVHSGSMCFRESLFEKDEFDEMDEEEDEEDEEGEDEDEEGEDQEE